MNITNDTTLPIPADGILHCTTITVAAGKTLRFNCNALNTPVCLLATGDVLVSGTIDVSASFPDAGPGGFNGGRGGSMFDGQSSGGAGLGPGGGGVGTYWNASFGDGPNRYGNLLLDPLIGGSGGKGSDGAGASPGGGGGGAILIASNSRIIVTGSIQALGGSESLGRANSGSGGGIRLVGPVVGGTGSLDARAGGVTAGWIGGGWGRIRIDCQDNQAYRTLNLTGVASRGMRMVVFPALIPALDIIEVAGNTIPAGTNSPVLFELLVGASTNQTVRVQARNFTNDVPIRVVVTPENLPAAWFDATILQSSGSPPFANVPVVIPVGSVCHIHAWTR